MSTARLEEFLSQKIFAVAGVSRDRHKYGYRVWRHLKRQNYVVYAVNPNTAAVDAEECYPDLESLPRKPEVVTLVIPPEEGLKVARECVRLGIRRLWFQPGAESADLLKYCEEQGLLAVSGQCLLLLA
jgi:uncharacterized protein